MIYVLVDGEPQGPFSADELSALWRAGDLDASALYWFRGMPRWLPVEKYAPPSAAPVAPELVLLTTTHRLAGREVEREIDVVSAEVAVARDAIDDALVKIRDAVGGRSATLEVAFRAARQTCLDALRAEASRLGADGVIGVSISYAPLTSGGGSVLLAALGTAVALGPPKP
jgi:uncharacterized protein YbjQ (UPF0145 family)